MADVYMFFDTETTGVKPHRHFLHQLSGLVEIEGKIVEEFDIRSAPHPKAEIAPGALEISNTDESDLYFFQDHKAALKQFTNLLDKYVDRYDPKDKIHLVGFNNRSFDDIFLQYFFELGGNKFMMAYFHSGTLDVSVLASEYLKNRRRNMKAFKLASVARELGVPFDKEDLHDALVDAKVTRQIYRIVTGIDMEI